MKSELELITAEVIRLKNEAALAKSDLDSKKNHIDELRLEIEDLQSEKQIIIKKSQNVTFKFYFKHDL